MALAFAVTAAMVLTAGTAAVAANLGILGATDEGTGKVGSLDAQFVSEVIDPAPSTQHTTAAPQVVVIDEEVVEPTVPASGGAFSDVGSASSDTDQSRSPADRDPVDVDSPQPAPMTTVLTPVPTPPTTVTTVTTPAPSVPTTRRQDDDHDDDHGDDDHHDDDRYDGHHDDDD